MDRGGTELLESVVHQLIDEEALGVCLEMHRAIKLGYYELLYPEDSVYEKHDLVDVKGLDIFGNAPQTQKKSVDCVCPNCHRMLGAQKFAPHLEKCMGMGRSSSRLANRKHKPGPLDSDQEGSDDNEEEWTYPERRANKRPRKEKPVTNSPRRGSTRAPGRPPKGHDHTSTESFYSLKQHNVASFSALPIENKHNLLQQICGVVSERTGKLCTRSVNCPQHTEEQRQDIRRQLLYDQHSLELIAPSPVRRHKESPHKSSAEASEDPDTHYEPATDNPLLKTKRKKMKSSKKFKKGGHRSITTATIMHSSNSLF